MVELKVTSFRKKYTKLDSELKINYPRLFNFGQLIAYNKELKDGFIVSNITDTTDSGTYFEYTKPSNKAQEVEYRKNVEFFQANLLGDELIQEINTYKNTGASF